MEAMQVPAGFVTILWRQQTTMQGFTEVFLGCAANLIPFYSFLAFSFLIVRWPACRTTHAAIIPVFMLLLQPVMQQVYAGPAFLSVLLAWEMIDTAYIKPVDTLPKSVLGVYMTAFTHSIQGMLISKVKRSKSSLAGSPTEAAVKNTALEAVVRNTASSSAAEAAGGASAHSTWKPAVEQSAESTTASGIIRLSQPLGMQYRPIIAAASLTSNNGLGTTTCITDSSNESTGNQRQPVSGTATAAAVVPTCKHLFAAAHAKSFAKASLMVAKCLLVFNLGFAVLMAISHCSSQQSVRWTSSTISSGTPAWGGSAADSMQLEHLTKIHLLAAGFNPLLYVLQQAHTLLQCSAAVPTPLLDALRISGRLLQATYASLEAAGFQPMLQYAALCAYSTAAGVVLTTQAALFWSAVKWAIVAAGQLQLAAALPDDAFGGLFLATSIGDLWGNRWHQFYRYYFTSIGSTLAATVTRPFVHRVPVKHQVQAVLAARVLAAFFLSGFLHEYVLYAAYGRFSGSNMAFFLVHGVAVVMEQVVQRIVPGFVAAVPVWVGRAWAVGITVASAPLMVRPFVDNGYFCNPIQPGLWGDMGVGTASVLVAKAVYNAVGGW